MFMEGFEAEGLVESTEGPAPAPAGAPDQAENFDGLDALMRGAKTRRAGRERNGQG
jgi:hypothetical protein